MKKVIMGLLVLAAIAGVVAMIVRRNSSDLEEWRSIAADSFSQAKDATKDVAKDVEKDTLDTAKDVAKDITSTS